ncbi:MAG: family 43 glycosylhydrolase [Bacteroidales bacterium]|nr:family 43 glycosylhydrolase [Bacteroidales bacterium]
MINRLSKIISALTLVILVSCGPEVYKPIIPNTNPGGGNSTIFTPGQGGDDHPVQEPTYYSNPVWKTYPSPDPTVIRVGDWFYSYSTEANIRILKSSDCVNWTLVGTAFTSQTRPRNVKTKEGKDVGLWAPDIEFIGGQYVLYYGQSAGDYMTGFGAATSDSPEGPFTDRGLLVYDELTGTKGNVDQFYFKDPVTGTQWMGWGSYGGSTGGLHIAELSDDGLSLKYVNKNVRDLSKIYRIAGSAWEGGQMYYHAGKYYLFCSGGYCCSGENSDYNVQVATSSSPTGPFVNKKGENLNKVAGTWKIMAGNDYAVGPGHVSEIILDDNKAEWIFYHGFVKGHADEYKRVLFLDRLTWDAEGYPVINGGLGPSSRSEAPYFKSN